MSNLFNADSNQQYGRSEKVPIFGVQKEENEDLYQLVINVAKEAGSQVSRADISICHRVPGISVKVSQGRPNIGQFVRRQPKNDPMTSKEKLKKCEDRIFINDDFTFLRARLAKALRQRHNITTVTLSIEKNVVYQPKNSKTVIDSLFQLYEWDPDFVCSVCRSSLHFCWKPL